ncbi:hypothetical protein QF034_007284 [Streptomyces africanus]|uniref:Uncharacterized protein n=1 Tax=Streptomyces africanus TaxID=231024 RepID=A0ABU0R089_9ACTN|nr:hypothetical protein [Streptomyces africanus]
MAGVIVFNDRPNFFPEPVTAPPATAHGYGPMAPRATAWQTGGTRISLFRGNPLALRHVPAAEGS